MDPTLAARKPLLSPRSPSARTPKSSVIAPKKLSQTMWVRDGTGNADGAPFGVSLRLFVLAACPRFNRIVASLAVDHGTLVGYSTLSDSDGATP
jgi:hypothetical protein